MRNGYAAFEAGDTQTIRPVPDSVRAVGFLAWPEGLTASETDDDAHGFHARTALPELGFGARHGHGLCLVQQEFLRRPVTLGQAAEVLAIGVDPAKAQVQRLNGPTKLLGVKELLMATIGLSIAAARSAVSCCERPHGSRSRSASRSPSTPSRFLHTGSATAASCRSTQSVAAMITLKIAIAPECVLAVRDSARHRSSVLATTCSARREVVVSTSSAGT
jgi:hypothetical protein